MLKNIFRKFLVLLLLLNLSILTSNAVRITDTEIEKAVKEEIEKNMNELKIDKYEVSVVHLPFQYLDFADNDITIKVDGIVQKSLTARMVVRVSFYADNKYIKSVGVPIALKAYRQIWVSKFGIERGETITKDKVELKLVDITGNTKDYLKESLLEKGVIALKPFEQDEVINLRFVKVTPDVTKNSVVQVIINSKDKIIVTTEALALSDGCMGDTINVQNQKLKKTYSGKIIGENKILVKL